jgi:electron transport complex protein RnfE
MPAGGFFVLGIIIAIVSKLASKKPPKEISCSSCPNASVCNAKCEEEK